MAASAAFEQARSSRNGIAIARRANEPSAGTPASRAKQAAPVPVQHSAVHDVISAPGQPLAAPVREEMEARLHADFSQVRVHTDAAARASAAEVRARAFTCGSHVVIADGGADKPTLAHELTHVIQQRTGPVAGTDYVGGLRLSDPSDPFERAAESNAGRVMSGSAPRAEAASPGRSVQLDGSSTAASAVTDVSATATSRSPNGEHSSQVNRMAIPVRAPQGVSSMTVQRAGRSQDLAGEPEDQAGGPLVIKVIIAGSSNEGWLTHVEKEPKWTRQNVPKKSWLSAGDSVPAHRTRKGLERFQKPEVSVAGPGGRGTTGRAALGALDIGSNSIENLVEGVPPIVQGMVEEEPREGDIVILIKAHSRGAVAASRVANKLNEIYQRIDTVRVELVQFDPVPGPGHTGENIEIDLSGLSESTVIYSVATGWGVFSPQTVLGAKRIIISQQGHLAGIKNGFQYNGQTYKGSRLNSLPEGVYFDDNKSEIGMLQRVGTLEEALKRASHAHMGAWKVHDIGRGKTIEAVLTDYFTRAGTASAGTSSNAT